MKKLLFTKGNGILALFAFVCFSLIYVACSKDSSTTNIETTSLKEPTPKEQAEGLTKTSYRYVKYYFGQKKPEDYVAEPIRKEVMGNLMKFKAEYDKYSVEEMIQILISKNEISKPSAEAMLKLKLATDALDNAKSYQEIETTLKGFEEEIYQTKELSDNEKIVIAATSGTIRESVRYLDEQIKINKDSNLQSRESCSFGRKASCFTNAIVKAGVGGLKAVVTGAATVAGIPGAVVGILVGLVDGLFTAFTDSSCKCNETPGCFQPIGINPIISSNAICNPAIGFGLWGSGTVPQEFRWWAYRTDAAGFEYPVPDVQDKITGTPALSPFVIPNPNELIRLVVKTNCVGSNSATKTFLFRLSSLLGDPGSVIITGSSNVSLFEAATYNLSGECVLNPNNKFQWFIPSQGILQSGGGNGLSATIQWRQRTCSSSGGFCFRPSVSVSSFNPCTNTQSSGGLGVAVY
jgi:hypothetical protein